MFFMSAMISIVGYVSGYTADVLLLQIDWYPLFIDALACFDSDGYLVLSILAFPSLPRKYTYLNNQVRISFYLRFIYRQLNKR